MARATTAETSDDVTAGDNGQTAEAPGKPGTGTMRGPRERQTEDLSPEQAVRRAATGGRITEAMETAAVAFFMDEGRQASEREVAPVTFTERQGDAPTTFLIQSLSSDELVKARRDATEGGKREADDHDVAIRICSMAIVAPDMVRVCEQVAGTPLLPKPSGSTNWNVRTVLGNRFEYKPGIIDLISRHAADLSGYDPERVKMGEAIEAAKD